MEVYRQTNQKNAAEEYAYMETEQGILEAEQDHYAFLSEFFRLPQTFLALWVSEGVYKAALRVEPYADGVLIEGVETAPDSRGKGFGTLVLKNTLNYLVANGADKVYSHIAKDNLASINLHEACGFRKLTDYAIFVDGSVDQRSFTYVYLIKKEGAVD
jgi:ribosomal protein S18 acetylase RimI-like enzyme